MDREVSSLKFENSTGDNSDENETVNINRIIDHLVESPAIFKSQQKDEPELSAEEKRLIARKTFDESRCLFLSKFGRHLSEEHLDYFEQVGDDDYEMIYHVNRLKRLLSSNKRRTDVKNRRYMALKALIEKGEYFSESEMMKRNPSLYEHLVGQYLTEDQKRARDHVDMKNMSYASLLIEINDREQQRNLYAHQNDDASSEDEEHSSQESDLQSDFAAEKSFGLWGEIADQKNVGDKKEKVRGNSSEEISKGRKQEGESVDRERQSVTKNTRPTNLQGGHRITTSEKQLLKQEFLTCMYESFLDGKDLDFDYSAVDNDEAYDNIDLRTQDEEEKYFDSEFPETVTNDSLDNDQSEDELDKYMKSLQDS